MMTYNTAVQQQRQHQSLMMLNYAVLRILNDASSISARLK